jgi:hypothetical protein
LTLQEKGIGKTPKACGGLSTTAAKKTPKTTNRSLINDFLSGVQPNALPDVALVFEGVKAEYFQSGVKVQI